jgi:hypothetical protein
VAIANNFFGWGLKLRLPDPEGVSLIASTPSASNRPAQSAR